MFDKFNEKAKDLQLGSSSFSLELLQPDKPAYRNTIDKKELTFVVPVYKLKDDSLKNLFFILPLMAATTCKVIVAEQTDDTKTTLLSELLKSVPNVTYVQWPKWWSDDHKGAKLFHKTALVNYIIKNHVKTTWVWVNGPNVCVKFNDLFSWFDDCYHFIMPYKMSKMLTVEETEKVLKHQKIEINFGDPQGAYENIYGDMSFVCRRETWVKEGGYDENYVGTYLEGLDLYRTIKLKNYDIQTVTNGFALRLFAEHIKDEEGGLEVRNNHPVKLDAKFGMQATSLETIDVNILTQWREKKPKLRHRDDLAVVTCHFNWSGFKRPVSNLNRFLRYMESKQIPVYGVELSLHGNFATKGNKNWLRLKVNENNILFQKECLLNLAEKMVPDKYTKIAWFDHDVFLDNDTWYDEASFALDEKQIVQLFEYCYWTTEVGTIAKELPAMCKYRPKEGAWTGHPGFGIAAKRTMWAPNIGGLYPYCPLGHGDTTFMYSIFETPIAIHTQIGIGLNNCPDFAPYHTWLKHIIDFAAGAEPGLGQGAGQPKKVGYVQGNCFHEWHGDIFNRSYVDRAFLMTWYNPEKHIFVNEQGILELQNTPETWTRMIQKYFMDRREDGCILEGGLQ